MLGFNDLERPLSVRTGAWRSMLTGVQAGCIAVVLAACGAALPWFYMGDGYISEAIVKLDTAGGSTVDPDAFMKNIHSQLVSGPALERTADELELKSSDFDVRTQSGELGILWDILTGKETSPSDETLQLHQALTDSIRLSLDAEAGVMTLSVQASTPVISEQISDYLSRRLVTMVNTGSLAPASQIVDVARAALDKTEASLTGFQMRHGNEFVSQMQELQQRLQEAQASASSVQTRQRDIATALAKAMAMKPQEVFTTAPPSDNAFLPLEDIRQKHAAAKMALAEVAIDHGVKHPKVIAANQAVEDVKAQAAPALKRIIADLKQEEKVVSGEFTTIARQHEQLKNKMDALGTAPQELAGLEAGLERARATYLAALDKSDGQNSSPTFYATIATPAGAGLALRDNTIVLSGAAAGALCGLLAAVFLSGLGRRKNDAVDPEDLTQADSDNTQSSMIAPLEDRYEPPLARYAGYAEPVVDPVLFEDPLLQELDTAWNDERHPGYDEIANDVPLDVLVRQVLMKGRTYRSQDTLQPSLPPLLSSALDGRFEHKNIRSGELQAVRQEMAVLKERLQDYATRKTASRR